MTKFLALSVSFFGASLIAMGISLAADQCDRTDKGFLPCAEGQVSEQNLQAAHISKASDAYEGGRRSRPGRHYPRPMPPPPGYYPPPAPFCYTPSGWCRMVVATPPNVYCTCNFGYFWDSGYTGY